MTNDNDYIEVKIYTGSDADMKDMLVAMLAGIGFEGFEEEKNFLKAFIPEKDFNESQLREITVQYEIPYSIAPIKYKNWNDIWEAGFEPVIIEKFCAVRATFHQPVNEVAYEIIITPKMSFGTGHHATTYLMLEAMKGLSMKGKSVFDFGTGTGVLAILAEKMGASEIEAIDIDEWSIENGKENLTQNLSKKILLYKSGQIATAGKFDIILANINRNIILQQMESMMAHLSPGGTIVLSGLLTSDEGVITAKAENVALKLLSSNERNSWICLQFVNA